MILGNRNTGQFEAYDLRDDLLTSASNLGTVGLDFQVAGFGPFHAPGASDMILRNANTGQFEVYDIVNNQITTANSLGAVGLDFQVGGFAAGPRSSERRSVRCGRASNPIPVVPDGTPPCGLVLPDRPQRSS